MNIAILVKMICKKFKRSSLIMSVVHSKRRKVNKMDMSKHLVLFFITKRSIVDVAAVLDPPLPSNHGS